MTKGSLMVYEFLTVCHSKRCTAVLLSTGCSHINWLCERHADTCHNQFESFTIHVVFRNIFVFLWSFLDSPLAERGLSLISGLA